MKRIIEFIGKPSDNGECFALEVDKDTFKAIKDREPNEPDQQFDFDTCENIPGVYMIYPDDVIYLKDSYKDDMKLKIKIIIDDCIKVDSPILLPMEQVIE